MTKPSECSNISEADFEVWIIICVDAVIDEAKSGRNDDKELPERQRFTAVSVHPCVSLVNILVFARNYRLMVGSSTENSANCTEEDTELAVRFLRRRTDDLPDGGETTEFSLQRTDDVQYEILEESEALSDVQEILTITQLLKWIGICLRPVGVEVERMYDYVVACKGLKTNIRNA